MENNKIEINKIENHKIENKKIEKLKTIKTDSEEYYAINFWPVVHATVKPYQVRQNENLKTLFDSYV